MRGTHLSLLDVLALIHYDHVHNEVQVLGDHLENIVGRLLRGADYADRLVQRRAVVILWNLFVVDCLLFREQADY